MPDLRVELYGTHLGTLSGLGARFDFAASREAIEAFGLGSTILSVAVPLDVVPVARRADRRRAFFDGLLPEGDVLVAMAARVRVATIDTLGMLAQYGRDCAGAASGHRRSCTPHTTGSSRRSSTA